MERNTRSNITFLVLMLFAMSRPIVSLSFFTETTIASMALRELYGLGISYVLLLTMLLTIRDIKLDSPNFILILLIFYAMLSLLWGSGAKQATKFALPFILFFTIRSSVRSEKQVITLMLLMFIGFLIPVIGSYWYNLGERGVQKLLYWSGLVRYYGMYYRPHEHAHEMVVFTFLWIMMFSIVRLHKNEDSIFSRSRLMQLIFFITPLLAVINLYKSRVRTTLLGLAIMGGFYILGKKKILPIIGITILGGVVFYFYREGIDKLFWDIKGAFTGETTIEGMGSGRISIWLGQLRTYFNYPFERMLLGNGIGKEVLNGKQFFGASHNDFMSVLLGLGLIGLLLYWMFYAASLLRIIKSKLTDLQKFILVGFVFGICFMNFASNSYISRFELGQYFFFFMGLIFTYMDLKSEDDTEVIEQ